VIDNVAARGATASITEPFPGSSAENHTGGVMYAAVGARMSWQVLAVKLIIFVVLECQLAERTCCRLYNAVQAVRQNI